VLILGDEELLAARAIAEIAAAARAADSNPAQSGCPASDGEDHLLETVPAEPQVEIPEATDRLRGEHIRAVGGQPGGELLQGAYIVVEDRVIDLQAADAVRVAG
jgi:hypothetical protein